MLIQRKKNSRIVNKVGLLLHSLQLKQSPPKDENQIKLGPLVGHLGRTNQKTPHKFLSLHCHSSFFHVFCIYVSLLAWNSFENRMHKFQMKMLHVNSRTCTQNWSSHEITVHEIWVIISHELPLYICFT